MNWQRDKLTAEKARQYMGHMSQAGGLVHYRLLDGKAAGTEAVDFCLTSGLRFTVLPGRGMDIAWASYCGIPLCYIAKPGVVSASHYEPGGMDWLRSFFAGLLTTCGLSNVGNPCVEQHPELGQISHGLHGRISNTPAEQVALFEDWEDDSYVLRVSGKMREAVLHGDNITLRRTYETKLNERGFTLTDHICNEGFHQHLLSILYHINIGYPLLSPDSRFVCRSRVSGTDLESRAKEKDFGTFREPKPFDHQYGFHHDIVPDDDGYVRAAVINDKLALGLSICYQKSQLPKFNQWTVMSTGEYVLGMEPGTCHPVGREAVEKDDEAPILAGGESKDVTIRFEVLDGKENIAAFENLIGL